MKPHKKKKLRTLQQDITASTEYEDYVSKLEGLPKLDPQATDAAPPGGEARKEITRRDSSEDEAIVAKLSNTLPQSEQTKSRNPGMSTLYKKTFISSHYVYENCCGHITQGHWWNVKYSELQPKNF